MAERKSVNKYYPPDWDPSKGSVNKYVGQHPLRDRARKLSQGILIIRFEMPYNIWCDGCNNHIGMGVRYNAEKTKTGMYYTTPIYKFRMKCHLCPNHFEIQTDPKNHDYVILQGARRKEQRWDPKENEQIVPEDRATHKKMATDAMFKLEHGSDDLKKGKAVVMTLNNLEGRREEWKDDYILNKLARQKFREEKKVLKSAEESDEALLSKSSLDIPLVKEREQDKRLAHLMKYRTVESYDEKQTQKRKEIESQPIFQPSKAQKLDILPTDKNKLNIIRKHLQTMGNKRTNPFDPRGTKLSKPVLDKVSLGIRRKPVNTVDQTDNDLCVGAGTSVDMSGNSDKTVTDSPRTEGVPETKIDNLTENYDDMKEINACDKDEHSENKNDLFSNETESRIKEKGNDNIAEMDLIDVKSKKTDSSIYDRHKPETIDVSKDSGSIVSTCMCKVDSTQESLKVDQSVLERKHVAYISVKLDTTLQEKCFKTDGKEPKPDCDNKTGAEKNDTVCDKSSGTDVKEVSDKLEMKEDFRTVTDIKVDNKNLSLVASYSDSDSDSCVESS